MQEDYTPDLISLSDDEGNEYNFEVLDAIETDDARYVALTPVFDDPEDETVGDAFIARLQDYYEIDEV